MSEKTLKQLVGALVVLVVIWGLSSLLRKGSGSIVASGEIGTFFDGIDSTSVQSVRFEHGSESIELRRNGADWVANDFPADSGSVARFLDLLGDVKIGDLVAENPDNHDRMGVSADSAWAVTFTTADGDRTLLVGDSGRRFGTSYVRLPGASEVYLLDGDLRAQVGRDLDAWRNRVMVAIDSSAVARIEVDRTDGGYTLVRGDSAWAFQGGGEVQQNAVDGVLAEFSHMVASGFLAEDDSIAGLDRAATARVLDATGEVLAEASFGDGSGERWARTPTDPYVYRVSSFRANRVAPPKETVTPGS